jgi:hypothetical protein
MRLYRYLKINEELPAHLTAHFKTKENENENIDKSFTDLEDPKVAKKFDYSRLTLKKAPKELSYIIKMLKKHLSSPLESIVYKNRTSGEGGMNVAIYSKSLDSMGINLTNIKNIKTGGSIEINYHKQLENSKESLEKWEEFYKKHPNDRKARGMVSKLITIIRNLENKIKSGSTPVPSVSTAYFKNKNDAIEGIILHELGHRVEDKYNMEKFRYFFNRGDFPTEYSKRNLGEYFSEVYALTKMKLIDKAPISDEAKEYFKKVIK